MARVSAVPDVSAFERITGARTADLVIGEIEAVAKSWVRRTSDKTQPTQ